MLWLKGIRHTLEFFVRLHIFHINELNLGHQFRLIHAHVINFEVLKFKISFAPHSVRHCSTKSIFQMFLVFLLSISNIFTEATLVSISFTSTRGCLKNAEWNIQSGFQVDYFRPKIKCFFGIIKDGLQVYVFIRV